MENKTISYLNSKAWYRLLKVVYLLVFLFSLIVAIAIINDIYGVKRLKDHRVACNYGSKANFLAYKDKGIYLSDYELENGLGEIPSKKDSLQTACEITKEERENLIVAIMKGKTTDDPSSDNYMPPLYRITQEQVVSGRVSDVVSYSLLTILLIVLVFEVVRRAFYYVVLGSVRPVK
jgi:hypothetical protein